MNVRPPPPAHHRHRKVPHAGILLLAGAFGAALAACDDQSLSAPYQVTAMTMLGPDPETGGGRYAVQPVLLEDVQNFEHLQSSFFQVNQGGVLREARLPDGTPTLRFEDVEVPTLRYRIQNGVALPEDYSTLAMFSTFHSLDVIMARLETASGLSPAGFVNGSPLPAYFEWSSELAGDVGTERLNAAYLPRPFGPAFLIYRRSNLETVPLGASLPVLSHEFGHAVFDAEVVLPTADAAVVEQLNGEFSFRGINEGYADILAFSISGSWNVIADQQVFESQRSLRDEDFEYAGIFRNCSGSFYCIGTLFARSVHAVAERRGGGDPAVGILEVGPALHDAFPGWLDRVSDGEQLPDPLLQPYTSERQALEREGEIIGALLDGLLQGIEPELRGELCAELIPRFGLLGFPRGTRGACL